MPDIPSNVATYFNTLLDGVEFDYPLYIGKTWGQNDSLSGTYYEVISEEDITVNIGNTPTVFTCYKVNLNLSALATVSDVNYYNSEVGIVKVQADLGAQYGMDESGTNYFSISSSYNYELFNYHLE